MTIRNRELSQFSSFIYVENSTQEIGITTGPIPFVGIGTTNPTSKLHIVGDVRIDGDLLYNGQLAFGDVDLFTSGIITARRFFRSISPGISEELRSFDTWESTPTSVYNINRNIGIGTTTPTERLEVKDGNVSATTLVSTASFGTPPLQVRSSTLVANLNAALLRGGSPGGNSPGDIITIDASQTLFNKGLEFPTIGITGSKFRSSGNGSIILRSPNNVLTDKEVLLPSNDGTLISTGDIDIISGDMITDFTIKNNNIAEDAGIRYTKLNLSNSIRNSDIAVGAGITNGKLANSTISNIPLGQNLRTLVAGNFITYTSSAVSVYNGPGYNGSEPLVISVRSSDTSNVPNTLVARDGNGNFNASNVTLTNLTVNQTLNTNALSLNFLNCLNANVVGVITATEFRRVGGTSSQFLKADGSVDTNTYLTLASLPTSAETLTTVTNRGNVTTNNIQVGIITATEFRRVGGTSSQFLKADGSIDSRTFLTASDLPATTSETLTTVTNRGNVTTNNIQVGIITATQFRRTGGLPSQFLKGDGSLDSTRYLTSSSLLAGTNITISVDSNTNSVTINSTGGGGGGATALGINDVTSGILYPLFSSATSNTISAANVSSSRISFNASNGNLTLSGGGSFVSTSDRNKKTNIKPLENPLDLVKKLNGVTFNWIENNDPSLGLIAQEVEEVLPDIVVTDSDGIKGVMYGNIVALLIEAIKEQQVCIEELQKKINS